jgi:sterol desaturase/sphingolipid hydroxylase (fatty acid hydroxylase superfamily)
MESILQIVSAVFDQAIAVLRYPLDPTNRIYFAYLGSSVIVAWFVYRAILRRGAANTPTDAEAASGSFLQFLFPKLVWDHPSAWLDLRYMLFHRVISHFLLLGIGGTALMLGFVFASGGMRASDLVPQDWLGRPSDYLFAVGYMVVTMLVLDFVGWAIHYLQHKVPLLWQFHKVHHSAEVMHPISNFREHPVDNLAYGFFFGLVYGAMHGLAMRHFGFLPTIPTLLGVPLMMLAFNLVGYNLRHSHVWLRWPGRWSMIFPSPAHHHVHHSCHPDHLDKNFAFMFPIWDVIFKTYHLPEDNRDVKFGIPDYDSGKELTSCLRLYFVPFRDAYRLFRKPRAEPSAPQQAGAEKTVLPAE